VALKKPKVPFASGNQTVQAIIRNYGSAVLEKASVQWKVNGSAQGIVQWTGSLAPSDSAIVELGTFNFVAGTSYSIDAEVSDPNGGTDANLTNNKLQITNLFPGLSGTYTIGGTNPDFTTFSQAVNALFIGGAAGPVTFNIRPGTYTEQIRIENYAGSNCTNPVVFQSENGDSSSVIIKYANTSSANYIVSLNGVQGIQFRNMIFRAAGGTYGTVFVIRGTVSCITVEGCEVSNNSGSTTSGSSRLVDMQSSNNSNMLWDGNLFKGGSVGIYLSGGSNSVGTVIRANTFMDQYYMAVQLESSKSPRILGNQIKGRGNYSDFYGLYLYNCNDSLEVSRNRIVVPGGGYGIYFYSSYGAAGKEGLVSNNFVSMGGSGASYGIYIYSSGYQRFYHNNVNVYGTNAEEGRAFYYYSSSNSKVYNNIFSNTGGGYAVYSSSTISTMDYNNLYSSGGKVGYYSGLKSTLADWKSAATWDAHSVSADPLFTSATDLHVNKADLDSTGVALAEIKQDIDGETRGTKPDIGADEFTPSGKNAALVKILLPAEPFNAGNYPVQITFKNGGVAKLDSVRLGWSVSGVEQKEIIWKGSLATGQSFTQQLGEIQFAEKKRYDVSVWVKTVNGSKDIDKSDDSLAVTSLYASLSAGTYTIGGTDPDFADFAAATTVLNQGGILGPVTFNIRPGTYTGQIRLENYAGNHCDNPVIFQSENGDSSSVIVKFNNTSSNNYLVYLNGVQGVLFRNMIFRAAGGTYGTVFTIRGNVSCITAEGCEISNNSGSTTSGSSRLVDMQSTTSTRILWDGNLFKGGSEGIYLSGTNSSGTEIRGNNFKDQYYMAVRLESTRSPKILGNEIKGRGNYPDYYGLYLYNCNDSLEVSRNRILVPGGGYGIYFYSSYGAAGKEGLVSNNFISMGGTGGSYGIYMYSSGYQRFYHNNVNVYGTHAEEGRAFYYYSSSNSKVYNNIFSNTGGGYAVYSSSTIAAMDYNNLYSSGGKPGYYSGLKSTLADWKSAATWDSHSVSADPLFTSATDLHVNKADLDSAGIALAEIKLDIDGETRGTPPDIGADEFTPSGKNAALTKILLPAEPFAAGKYPVQISFKNSGVSKIDSIRLGWSVSGIAQKEIVWNGSLLTGQADTLLLGEVQFDEKKRYDVSVWIKSVNGDKDIDDSDDSLLVKSLYTSLSPGTYTIGGTEPDFADFAAATTVINEGGILGPVIFNVRPGTYTTQIRLENYAGNHCDNPVIFQSENGDSSSVILKYTNTSSNNYLVYLNGVQGVQFRNMILRAAGGTYGTVFLIRGNASCITTEGCEISNNSGSTTSGSSRLVDIQSSNNSRMLWAGNLFKGGSEGFYLYGGTNSSGTVIRGNNFKDQYYMGIHIEHSKYPRILGNEIRSRGNYSDYFGLYLYNCNDSLEISRNRIYSPAGGYGLYLYSSYGAAGKEGLISNNFISTGGSSTSYGIHIYSSGYQRLYHNNVNVYGTNAEESRAFYNYSSSNIKVYNNIFSNSGAGYAVYSNGSNITMDYNNLYSSAGKVGNYSGLRATLAEWQSAGTWDVHSVSANPLFISSADLHVEGAFLNAAGTPLKEVTADIDGQPRDPLKPDIGADEITSSTADAGITKLISPAKPFSAGPNVIQVEILNNSGVPLESAKLSISINGNIIGTTLWKGSIAPGKVSAAIADTFDFAKDNLYTIDVKISEPNGLSDSDSDNDSIRVTDLYPGLGGTYTIGGENPDFDSFATAILAMEKGGIYKGVTFLVRSGTYKGKIRIPEIKGASAENRILFKPLSSDSAAVIISDASNTSTANYVVNLSGADYVTFEGFVIKTESASYARIIWLNGQSAYNTFKNNIIAGRVTTSTSDNFALIWNEEGINGNQYLGNTFINGSTGIYHTGKSLSGTGAEEGALIQGNKFTNQAYNAIQLRYQQAPVITENTITSKGARSDYNGISLYYCSDNLLCTKNKVSADNGNTALRIEYCEANQAKKPLVANNMFQLTTGSQSSYAIYLYGSQWCQLYHNTAYIKSNNAENAALYIQSGGNHRVVNNILSNGGTGYAFYVGSPGVINESNYNNLYSAGANLGYWLSPRADLALWRVASVQDANSVTANPLFVTDQDLHARQRVLNGAAKPLTEVTEDIDGESRSKTIPDIGADEFEYAILKDLAVKEILSPKSACDLDTMGVVSAKIQNLGTAVLDSFTVAYELAEKGLVVKETFKQSLQPQEEKIIKFAAPLKFPYGASFAVRVFALQKDDIDRGNDTVTATVINYPEVSFLLSDDTTICKGKSVVLKVQGGISRKWNTGATAASVSVAPESTTTYTVQVWNEFACTATDSVKITVLVPDRTPEVIALSDVNFCVGDTAYLTSNIKTNITWSTGETRSTILAKKSGSYYVDYKYTTTCTVRSAAKQVTAYEVPVITVDGFTSVCLGDSTKLIAGNATTQLWSTGQTVKTIIVKPVKDTLYKVSMSNAGCSREDSIQIKIVPAVAPGVVSGMLPADKAIDVYLPLSLSWLPAENATEYDVYIWPSGTARPAAPAIKRLKGINVVYGNLSYEKTYNWQVVSATSCLTSNGPVQQFTVRTLPNLVTDAVQVLAAPFSGQTIGVSWKVTNTGAGPTSVNGTWKDEIYLSVDGTKGNSDVFLGSADNTSALQPGGSYTNNAAVKLPEDAIGPYYILVISNYQGKEPETVSGDNMKVAKLDIALSPPPDVQVVEILPPGVNGYAFSGEKINLTYTVKNMGTGAVKTNNWRDLIQWSVSEVYDPSKLRYVGYIYHSNELLLPGESSRKTIEVKLPDNYAGTIYFYVTTDESDDVFEHLHEDNNRTRSQPLDVLLVPPPDLEIAGCDFGGPVFSAQSTFSVQYKTINDGGSATNKLYWRDSLYLSPVNKITAASIRLGAVRNGNTYLSVDGISTMNFSKRLKNFKDGKYFFIIKTDISDLIYEGVNEENNIYIHEDTVFIQNPDLTIATASVSDETPLTGDKVRVSWAVKNSGGFNLLAQPKFDKIYVSSENVLDSSAVKVGEIQWNNLIATGATVDFETEITLPLKFINGDHYIHIVTDAQDSVYESNEANNRFLVPLNIKVAPWADLVPQSIAGLPKTMRAGIKFPVSFTVKNKGDYEASADIWVDKLYGSISRKWHPDSVVLIAEFPRYLPLAPGESYTVNAEVAFPMLGKFQIGLDSFAYIHTYLYVDSSNHVFEYQAKGNNILQGDSVLVRCPPHTNFNLIDAYSNVPDTVSEASTFTLNWEVQNLGNTTSLWNYKLWYDGLYLSEDTIFDKKKDVFIYDWTVNGPVGLEEIYSKYQTFKIPYEHFGDYYLLLAVDHTDLIHDASNHSPRSPIRATAGRKYKVVRTASGLPEKIHIQRVRKPELQIVSFKVPATAIAGQPLKLEWTIKNAGDSPVPVTFTDNISLSGALSEPGRILGSYNHFKKLAEGESYTVTKEYLLPVTASGNYFIVLNTDAGKQIYESMAGEENNRAYFNISVIQQTPSDLVVTGMKLNNTSQIYTEQTVPLEYVAKNIGVYSASGLRKDLVYLSKDRTFESGDILISTEEIRDEILPYQEKTRTTQIKIPGVLPGNYYVIVVIDASNNILESDDENNSFVSVTPVNIQLPQLTIGTAETFDLENKKDKVYEIKVPEKYKGETLIITLDSDAYPALNELYVSKDKMPGTSDADYTYLNANSADQKLLIETLETGSYFLLVKGSAQKVTKQNVALKASILPFEIRSVDASQGGNTGNVTLNIEGAKFDRNMTARLVMGTKVIVAERMYFNNSTKVYATFNLKGAPLGTYDVVLQKGTEKAVYPQGFTVVQGSYGNSTSSGTGSNQDFTCSISYNKGVGNLLDQELDYPSAVRRNRTVEINIYFRNNGNVDMEIPSRFLLSVSGHPVSLTVEGLEDMKQDLFLEFKEKDGPPGILRPGAQGVIRAYTRSFTSGTVIELLLEE
jgi:parallel beta-helix repeat protein